MYSNYPSQPPYGGAADAIGQVHHRKTASTAPAETTTTPTRTHPYASWPVPYPQAPAAPVAPTATTASPFYPAPYYGSAVPTTVSAAQAVSPSSYYETTATGAVSSPSALPASYGNAASVGGAASFYPAHTASTLYPTVSFGSIASSLPKENAVSAVVGYPHNAITASVLIPLLYWTWMDFPETTMPLMIALFSYLTVYATDLAALRQTSLALLWWTVPLLTAVACWFWLMQMPDPPDTTQAVDKNGNAGGVAIGGDSTAWRVLFVLFRAGTVALLCSVASSFWSLQYQWLAPSMHRSLQAVVHAVLPILAAAMVTYHMMQSEAAAAAASSPESAAMASPLLFAALLAVAMLLIGAAHNQLSSPWRSHDHHSKNGSHVGTTATNTSSGTTSSFAIPSHIAWGHVSLLLLAPPSMHLATCSSRILFRLADLDDVYDLLLTVTIPYLLLYVVRLLHQAGVRTSPYGALRPTHTMARFFLPCADENNDPQYQVTLLGSLFPFAMALLSSWVLQQRYCIALAHSISTHLLGSKAPTWLLSLYGTAATASFWLAAWLWSQTRSASSGLVSSLGEYQDDVLQLLLALTGLFLGKAVGLPWNFTPLPILAFLGLSMWFTTRMLRYLAVFLFVVHATGMVVFTYRFAGMDHINTAVSLPGGMLSLSLTSFGLVVVGSSVLVGLAAGLSVRSSGGFLAKLVKSLDVTGLLMIAYTIVLMALELTLLKRPIPHPLGTSSHSGNGDMDAMLYPPAWIYATSAMLIALTLFMKQVKILPSSSTWTVISLAVGKVVATLIDQTDQESRSPTIAISSTISIDAATAVWIRSWIATALCIILVAPRILLTPVHVKARSTSSLSSSSKRGSSHFMAGSGTADLAMPSGTASTLAVYALLILPTALVVAVPYVLYPLAAALSGSGNGSIQTAAIISSSMPVSELVGVALALWGLAVLSMIHYYLPDGGAETMKKMAGLSFCMGVAVFVAAPTLGWTHQGLAREAAANPYASMSSWGSHLLKRSKSRTGGWGVLSAGLATLLSMAGPLELQERTPVGGHKDRFLLFRTMIFSVLFGCGLSWFVIVQSMSETEWHVMLFTMIASMAMAFLGTVGGVVGYFLELENWEEVEQLVQTWMVAFAMFLFVSGIPYFFLGDSTHPFGDGGWLSTYLVVCGISAFAFALALRFRPSKDQHSRGLSNSACLFAWICSIAVLYGRFGVAGMDLNLDVTHVFGVAASVVGTFLVGPILLLLEGEKGSTGRSGRRLTVTTSKSRPPSSSPWFAVRLTLLNRSNYMIPYVFGSFVVFTAATLYVVLLRGSIFFGSTFIPRGPNDVFSKIFGDTSTKNEHDLATLASKTISHDKALRTAALLAGSGIWTSNSMVGPMIYLLGILATIPNIWFCVQRWWYSKSYSMSLEVLGLPLNVATLFFCTSIPTLRAAALTSLLCGALQVIAHQQADQQSRMRI